QAFFSTFGGTVLSGVGGRRAFRCWAVGCRPDQGLGGASQGKSAARKL
ncbi:MAG: hypothetical protein QOH96_1499, partial [Blastocatellia bacterium]|nr:hypothetical protein [Blastocatellia bacterium]